MHLVTRALSGRSFLLQFVEILQEFGSVIPWLEPLKSLRHVTNATHFRDTFLHSLGCQEATDVTPFQLVTSDQRREYVGGILHFSHSPEVFRDHRNQEIRERLAYEGCHFVTCLQVQGVRRGQGHGLHLMQGALRTVIEKHRKVWGVVSDQKLLPWYQSFNGKLQSPLKNKDNLWIVTWE